jgi:hypothetical protein
VHTRRPALLPSSFFLSQNQSFAAFSLAFFCANKIAAPIRSRSCGVLAVQLATEPSSLFRRVMAWGWLWLSSTAILGSGETLQQQQQQQQQQADRIRFRCHAQRQ